MTNNRSDKPAISPELKVAEFLRHYPELESDLIGLSPAFAKLNNPVLRKTVAKVATLKQAAAVGEIPVAELINQLRQAAGVDSEYIGENAMSDSSSMPFWVSQGKPITTIDARPQIERGQQPITELIGHLNMLQADELLEVVTPFYPAPLIDKAKSMGFKVWSCKIETNFIKNYFQK